MRIHSGRRALVLGAIVVTAWTVGASAQTPPPSRNDALRAAVKQIQLAPPGSNPCGKRPPDPPYPESNPANSTSAGNTGFPDDRMAINLLTHQMIDNARIAEDLQSRINQSHCEAVNAMEKLDVILRAVPR
jgi:hypothetical protein